MTSRSRFARPCLEPLDGRVVPANLTVTFAAGTLTVVGDANANDVTVNGDAASSIHFQLTSSGTINGQASPFSTPTGVKNLVFKMLAGDDSVTFSNTVPIKVAGNVSINGGDGVNTVKATDLTVVKNIAITNGAQITGTHSTTLINLSVGGNVTIKSTAGDTYAGIHRNSVGVSTIKGNLTITNGAGFDIVDLNDTNVDHNVTVNNGHGNAGGAAGFTWIFNADNTAFRSVIGGNVVVTYRDGNVSAYDAMWDTEVLGNVTYNHGPGAFTTEFDGYKTQLPVLIHGNLSVLGTGANSVGIGTQHYGTGMIVGKKFTLTSGGTTAETLSMLKLQVGGNTSLKLGDGGNTVSIDDSLFGGAFALKSGAGADTINLETTAGTNSATEFKKAVLIDLGSGSNTVNLVLDATNLSSLDAGQAIVIWSKFTILSGGNTDKATNHIFFPNGGSL